MRAILTALLVAALTLPVAATAQPTPIELLTGVRDHYQTLSSFSMRIDHHDDSGLFPGAYAQTLRWRKGDRFELVVTSPTNQRVPGYYANGKDILLIHPGNRWTSDALAIRPNTSPGWEVSGGLILSWLQGTEVGKLYFSPPPELKVEWSYGPRTEWHGRRVRELIATFRGEQKVHFFVDESAKTLVGHEAKLSRRPDAKAGWALYTDQKMNPKLPTTLGDPPVTQERAQTHIRRRR